MQQAHRAADVAVSGALEGAGLAGRAVVRRGARIDRVVSVTRPTPIEMDRGTADIQATRYGMVLIDHAPGWTWYRWVAGGRLWSVTQERPRTRAQAQREGARLLRACVMRLPRRLDR